MDGPLTFVLNGERETVSGVSPATTLLEYLRRHKRLTGTKEGCAEGDCGACTVLAGELAENGSIKYRPVNSCIQFLPMMHGKSVVTVEGLASPDGRLHPAQQTIVDRHGSQCGFCTPGFVMSLYALGLDGQARSRQEINDALAGNLCRCTGYGPLIEAAGEMASATRPQWDLQRQARERELLAEFARDACAEYRAGDARFFAPSTSDELAALFTAHPDATLVAGATDVGLWVTKQHRNLPKMIYLGRVRDLQYVQVVGASLLIGATATYSDAAAVISQNWPDFGELIRRIGAVQVRSAGTIGGNIANGSPIGDMPPALIALGARLKLRCGEDRREIPLEVFFLEYGKQDRAPGEFIEAVEIPLADDPMQLRCYKISKRFDQDISALCGCFNISVHDGRVSDARIAFGGMAGIPKRASHVEQFLTGKAWSQETIAAALPVFERDFSPLTDMRASAAYRMLAAKNLLRRYFIERSDPAIGTRLAGENAELQDLTA